MSELWQRLRHARRYADMTQSDLAQACAVTRGAVALWEAEQPEHRTRPTIEHLMQIARVTSVPLDWLMNDASRLDELWQLAVETGAPGLQHLARPAAAPAPTAPPDDPLPELRHGDDLFVFAQATASSIAQKVERLAAEPASTRTHLIVVAQGRAASAMPSVHVATSAADALATVVRMLHASA